MEHRNRNNGGRIILLGDGTEVLTDAHDGATYDHDESEDKGAQDADRNDREGTPGPNSASSIERTQTPESTEDSVSNDSPAFDETEHLDSNAEPKMKAATDSPLSSQEWKKHLR